MISSIWIIVAMISAVAIPTAIGTTVTTVVRKNRALKNQENQESKLRNVINSETKDAKYEKKLLKKYFKSNLRTAHLVTSNYDNLSYNNYFRRHLPKEEIKRRTLIAKLGLAKLSGNILKSEKLQRQLNEMGTVTSNSRYNIVQKENIGGMEIEFPSNSIHCDSKVIADKYQTALTTGKNEKGVAYNDTKKYPEVTEIYQKDKKIASIESLSQERHDDFVVDLLTEIYVKSLVDVAGGETTLDYRIVTFDTDKKVKNKTAVEKKFTSPEQILDYLKTLVPAAEWEAKKEKIYEKAKEIAKELFPETELTINGEKINKKKTTRRRERSDREETVDTSEEKITCDSTRTKQRFSLTFTDSRYAPEATSNKYTVSIGIDEREKFGLSSNSRLRAVTFTVDLLAEAYRLALAKEAESKPVKVGLITSHQDIATDGSADTKVNHVDFTSSADILKYVTDNYAISEEDFNKKVTRLNTELGPIIPGERETEEPEFKDKLVCENTKVKDRFNALIKTFTAKDMDPTHIALVDKTTSKNLLTLDTNKKEVKNQMLIDTVAMIYATEGLADVKNKSSKFNYELQVGDKKYEIKNLIELTKFITDVMEYNLNSVRERAASLGITPKSKDTEFSD